MSMTDDDTGFSIKVFADLNGTLGSLRDEMRAGRQRDASVAEIPVDAPLMNNVVVGSSGLAVMGMSGPQMGRVRSIRRLVIGGLLPTTAAAGSAYVFVSASPVIDPQTGVLAAGCLGNLVDIATSLPNVAFYGERDIILRHHERLWVVISSGTNTQLYQAAGSALDYQEAAFQSEFNI